MTANPAVWPGRHLPLGAHWTGSSTNFAVWSREATGVDLCLFDEHGVETRLPLQEHTLGVWHGEVPAVGPGQRYGFRAAGPWNPGSGRRFNDAKLLLDPYARAVTGDFVAADEVFDHHTDGGSQPVPDGRNSAAFVPRSVVVDDDFDWSDDVRPGTALYDTVIYELHAKGFTAAHPQVPADLRGTYAGLASEPVVNYLVGLGVTAVELLPVHHFVTEPAVQRRGMTNYWGYNSVGFFAPHAGYAAHGTLGQQVAEFKQMVKTLHQAGLEVILDVVYNHTAEGGPRGPTLCFRGLGDAGYYLRNPRGDYVDVTGCGNTVDLTFPPALQLVMDSLRYWVTQMHVDGFRFDLASALTRNSEGVDLSGPFLSAVGQDPVLQDVKLIAEPWDASGGGYLLGSFPGPWCEWNDRFRDTVRYFWRGSSGGVRDLGYRLSGSSDLYADDGRLPYASVNLVTAHDGFTLRDLVSYSVKHNEANGEENRDGTDGNRSWNCGVEGDTDDPAIDSLRQRYGAGLLATLLLSTGVPMLTAGDERGRTQRGNNNAYCQDNELTWLDWGDDAGWPPLLELTRELLRLRSQHPVLRQRHFFEGRPTVVDGRKDLAWFHPRGDEMATADWFDSSLATLGAFLAGDALRGRDRQGQRSVDTSHLLWLHAGSEDTEVVLPPEQWARGYEVALTSTLDAAPATARLEAGGQLGLGHRSVTLLRALS